MAPSVLRRRSLAAALLVTLPGLLAACNQVDWESESRWWKKPTRQVHPTGSRPPQQSSQMAQQSPPSQPPPPDTRQAAAPRPAPAPVRSAPAPRPAPAGNSESVTPVEESLSVSRAPTPPAREPQRAPAPAPIARRPAETSASPRPVAPPSIPPPAPPAPRGNDEFYQVYLLSGAAVARPTATSSAVRLDHLPPKAAVRLLTALYEPIGTGGADNQQYLIYQDVDEWRSAGTIAQSLDGLVADNSALGRGASLFAEAVQAELAPPPEKLKAALTALTDASADSSASAQRRWMGAMLAGHVATDELYDYAAARQQFDQAAASAAPGSIEQLSAWSGKAQTFRLEGNKAAESEIYSMLVSRFAGHPRAQAMQRAAAATRGQAR
ncbi:MAG: hypothetical protein U1A27_07380 [Phycisphaerae bacterium]